VKQYWIFGVFWLGLIVVILATVSILRGESNHRNTIYIVTSDLQTAVETISNAPNVYLNRSDAETAAHKEYSKVFRVTIDAKPGRR
jgi:hypothetical protein